MERPPDTERVPDPRRQESPEHAPDRAGSEDESERSGGDIQSPRCVEDEQRVKPVVEEIERRHGDEGRAEDRVCADEPQPGNDPCSHARLLLRLDRRLLGPHSPEEERRDEIRDCIPEQRERRAEGRREQPAGDGPATDEKERLPWTSELPSR
jgi:hypothetical protein